MEIRTERLVLRSWRETDIAPFAAMCADAEVMAYFERTQTHAEAEALVRRCQLREAEDGFCIWALEAPDVADFVGLAGIQRLQYQAHFTPAVEVGWRLARPFWRRGYATEAALASMDYGFGPGGLSEIVAVAVGANARSLAVMERIGMRRVAGGDFDHPSVPLGHRLQPHVLYRITRALFRLHPIRGTESPNRSETATRNLRYWASCPP